MQRLTQTKPNCWQLCVAMLLDCDPETLPDQPSIAGRDRERYAHVLRVYLRKHHGVTYAEVPPSSFESVARQRIFHLMIGETVRTVENDAWHAIVGLGGQPYWDVHPSRAGLTQVFWYGLIIPIPDSWEDEWRRRESASDPDMLCVCPICADG